MRGKCDRCGRWCLGLKGIVNKKDGFWLAVCRKCIKKIEGNDKK